jgi:RNA polymerase sigma factor (sigma-70 family)
MNVAVRDLQTLFEVGSLGGLSDGQLLDRFVARREGAVFEAIVHRHGPMVWGVCRRVLRNHHDAEDAFQATFLVLARKAASVMIREKLGNWLYGVAYQTAMKARAVRTKRRVREVQVSEDMPEPMVVPHELRDALAESLDSELSRLPEKYRIPIVLCELEGKTHKEAASQLGWPIGTVSSRLSRARTMLARRLSRPGMTLSGVSLAVLLAQDVTSASMPTQLIGSTARAASLFAAGGTVGVVSARVAILTREVMKMMLLSKLKISVAMLVVVSALAVGGGDLAYRAQATEPALLQATEPSQEETIQGSWVSESTVRDGKTLEQSKGATFKFGKDTLMILYEGGRLEPGTHKYKLGTSDMPKTIDLKTTRPNGKEMASKGIYSLKGDTLIICLAEPGAHRPTDLRARADSRTTLVVLRRGGKQNEAGPRTKGEAPSSAPTGNFDPTQRVSDDVQRLIDEKSEELRQLLAKQKEEGQGTGGRDEHPRTPQRIEQRIEAIEKKLDGVLEEIDDSNDLHVANGSPAHMLEQRIGNIEKKLDRILKELEDLKGRPH